MLAQLNIRNLAVVDEVEVEFGDGYTVLTGETGAGKSILVDALALALGERADSRAIRSGSERCEITAVFDMRGRPELRDWLSEKDLDENDECILRRVVTTDGRSRGYVNGHSVPMQTLRELGEQLVDICGQQTHQSLRHAHVQRELLDQFGGHEVLLQNMQDTYDEWSGARHELDTLSNAQADRASRIELLQHHVQELEALNPQHGEFDELEQSHKLAANSGRIAADVMQALDRAYEADDSSAHSILSGVRRTVDDLVELDVELAVASEMLAEAEILLAEAAEAMRHRLDRLEHDPAAAARLEQRLAGFHDLARKHRVEPGALPELLSGLTDELRTLETSDRHLEQLAARTDACRRRMLEVADVLTQARGKAAAALAQRVTGNMQTLGMPDGSFDIKIRTLPGDEPGPGGHERIEFVTAINAGQAAGPLNKVASGGELSRISLSLQVAAMATESIPTLIFDEVDAGVGGGVAEIVGGRLHDLADNRQVLCVTHLPQVASQANHHLRVTKISDRQTTRTSVNSLTPSARIDEIARMLGGVEITARTRAHAKEMLKLGRTRKVG